MGNSKMIMKYFDYECCYEDPDKLFEERCLMYNKYIDSIYTQLPCGFRILARDIYLHDSIIRECIWDKKNKKVTLECDCEDLDIGYVHLTITYFDLYNQLDLKKFEPSQRYKHVEINRSEIELLDSGYISHKMIFFTRNEIEFISKNVSLKIDPSFTKVRNIPCEVTII